MNEKNGNIVLNCSYNPMYEGNEEPNIENFIIPNINNIFEPRTDGIEMINETIIQMPQRVRAPRVRAPRVRPHPPPPPPHDPPQHNY